MSTVVILRPLRGFGATTRFVLTEKFHEREAEFPRLSIAVTVTVWLPFDSARIEGGV